MSLVATEIPIWDIALRRGDGEEFTLTITQNDLPVNITLAEIRYTVKRNLTDTDVNAVIKKSTSTSGVTISDGPNGVAIITFNAADTENLKYDQKFFHDAQLQLPGQQPHTLFSGKLILDLDVTNTHS